MLSVLVVSPHPSVPGGVSVFIESMKRHVTRSAIDSFHVGSVDRGDETALKTLRRLLVAPLQLARQVRQRKYDVVHMNPSFDLKALIRDGLLILVLRAVGYRRILFFFHGWDFGLQRLILKHALLRHITAWVLNRAALITVLADDFRDGLIKAGVDPKRIIVTRTMYDGSGLEAVRGEAVISQRRFILFMSRFEREKGARELMRAYAALAPHYADLDLVLAGAGADEEWLRAEARKAGLGARVTFPGYVGGADKWRLLHDCAIFALPTYYRGEGMPVAILEAMGAGKPLLAGAAGALRSILTDMENGVVLRAISPQTVEAGLRRLLDNAAFAEKTGRFNAEKAQAKFEAHAVTREIEDFYQRVASC